MTPEQLRTMQVGQDVLLREAKGRITQLTRTWFRVVWHDGVVEAVPRRQSIKTDRMQLLTMKGTKHGTAQDNV